MEFEVQKIKWNPTGKNMTVIDKVRCSSYTIF